MERWLNYFEQTYHRKLSLKHQRTWQSFSCQFTRAYQEIYFRQTSHRQLRKSNIISRTREAACAHTVCHTVCRAGSVPPAHPFQVNEFYFKSWTPKIAKALMRTFQLVLKGFDVIPIVAPENCRL
jgi:hypothetical protein